MTDRQIYFLAHELEARLRDVSFVLMQAQAAGANSGDRLTNIAGGIDDVGHFVCVLEEWAMSRAGSEAELDRWRAEARERKREKEEAADFRKRQDLLDGLERAMRTSLAA